MELFKMTCHEVKVLRDDTLEKLINFNSTLKIQYAAVKDGVNKAKELQQRHIVQFSSDLKKSTGQGQPFKVFDERVELLMQTHAEKLRETDLHFKQVSSKIKKPLQDQTNKMHTLKQLSADPHETFRISKALLYIFLQKVDPVKLSTLASQTHLVKVSQEQEALSIIRRMKAEKVAKIIRCYKAYKLRQVLKKKHAARKILKWYQRVRKEWAAKVIQRRVRGYLAVKQVRELKAMTTKGYKASQIYKLKLIIKALKSLKMQFENKVFQVRRIKFADSLEVREESNVLAVQNMLISKMISKGNLWAIVEEEGKYKMAVEYHRKRQLAATFVRGFVLQELFGFKN